MDFDFTVFPLGITFKNASVIDNRGCHGAVARIQISISIPKVAALF